MERSKHFAGMASLRVLTSGMGLTSATAVSLVLTGVSWVRDVVVIMVGKKGNGRDTRSDTGRDGGQPFVPIAAGFEHENSAP